MKGLPPPKKFFVKIGRNSFEVVWKLHESTGYFHAIRPNGSVTVCGKKSKLVDPTVPDPSDDEKTCLGCAEAVVRVLREARPVDLKRAIWLAKQAQD